MKTTKYFLLIAVVLFSLSSYTAQADFAQRLNYQGRLTDSNGVPVADGTYSVVFQMYDAETAGSSVWGPETHASTDVESGLFSVLLGDSEALSGVDFNQDVWLEISVGGTTYSPRQRLTGVTYALTVPELSISTAKIANLAVTSGKIADSAVNSAKVQNNTLTADDLLVNVVSSVDGVTNDGGNIDLVAGTGITITPSDAANTITITANTSAIDQWVDEAGDTMSGDLDMGDNAITNIDWSTSDDGAGSSLDADLLDGQQGTYYRDASNINAGTLNNARFSAYSDLTAESKIGTGSTQVAAGNHNHDTVYMPIAQDDWVDEAGDTMSGTLNMGNQAITNINWGTSDDGSGSSLDADLLDGLDSTAFMTATTDDWVDETGDTMSGNLIVNANIGVNVASPASQLHVDETAQIGTDEVAQNTNLTMWAENGYEATLILRETSTHGIGFRYNSDENTLYLDRYQSSATPTPVFSTEREAGTTQFYVDVSMGNNALTNIDWSTSDDGSGSSLDADLLDGLDSTAFMTAASDNWVDEAGDTMTGALNLTYSGNPSIEIRSTSGGTPFIDFSNDSSTDYDGRFILSGDNEITLSGAALKLGTCDETTGTLEKIYGGQSDGVVKYYTPAGFKTAMGTTMSCHIRSFSVGTTSNCDAGTAVVAAMDGSYRMQNPGNFVGSTPTGGFMVCCPTMPW
ncbi:MAG TPA: hypothetical protein PLN69_09325 [bacterium]|nr:hypothetical protein [bacterium]